MLVLCDVGFLDPCRPCLLRRGVPALRAIASRGFRILRSPEARRRRVGLGVWGLGLGFGVQGLGLRVSSLGFLDVSGLENDARRFAISVLTPDQHP